MTIHQSSSSNERTTDETFVLDLKRHRCTKRANTTKCAIQCTTRQYNTMQHDPSQYNAHVYCIALLRAHAPSGTTTKVQHKIGVPNTIQKPTIQRSAPHLFPTTFTSTRNTFTINNTVDMTTQQRKTAHYNTIHHTSQSKQYIAL